MSIITKCCRIKASIVQSDERETGLRRVLNFGHTVGHAIESATKYRRFRHGEAVAFGMLAAASIAESRGEFSATDCDELGALIRRLGPLPSSNDLSIKQIINTIKQDKKIIQGKLHFVLPTGVGLTTIVEDVTSKQIERALKQLGMRN
jgi:3-dehydroquinate synthase